jgi:2,4-dienoyl-CoA reductase-like NADH-dependent reductase (Old Yellow Enzyme family)|tara:strand:- start:3501 stop:4556 length:1056 start_codon:yes stop_codon:yes gene_type:complete
MVKLFDPINIRGELIKNRAWVSPMCTYSSDEGKATDWHLVHLGSRAIGGAGLVMVEASAVTPKGRISPWDLGIWDDEHINPLKNITEFIKSCGATPAIQLAHAGRKSSTDRPWAGGKSVGIDNGGWNPKAPSSIKYSNDSLLPEELSIDEIKIVISDFIDAAKRSIEAGFTAIELHFAHGYLVHQFLSPLSNIREDEYGGSFDSRILLALEIASSVRKEIGNEIPLFARLSVTEYFTKGWDVGDSINLSIELKKCGIDLIDCSSGGNYSDQKIDLKPGYQVHLAESVKKEAGILTGAVGLITDSIQAQDILDSEKADVIFMAREYLRNPYWALNAEKNKSSWPLQYQRSID